MMHGQKNIKYWGYVLQVLKNKTGKLTPNCI